MKMRGCADPVRIRVLHRHDVIAWLRVAVFRDGVAVLGVHPGVAVGLHPDRVASIAEVEDFATAAAVEATHLEGHLGTGADAEGGRVGGMNRRELPRVFLVETMLRMCKVVRVATQLSLRLTPVVLYYPNG